jgi:hypothetical protein
MAGKKGMYHKKPDAKAVRRMIWRSMRVMRTFTLAGLAVTVPGATYGNVRKFVHGMHRHGVVTKIGGYVSGRAGDQQQYHLVKNSGPVYPTVCEKCGQPLSAKICDPSLKEREKEKETKKEREEVVTDDHDRPDATAA